jgi:hypothetical protein
MADPKKPTQPQKVGSVNTAPSTYKDFRTANDAAYTKQAHQFLHAYWPLESQGQFNQIHKMAMDAICNLMSAVDWSNSKAVEVQVEPLTAAVDQLMNKGVGITLDVNLLGYRSVVRLLVRSIQTELATGNYNTPGGNAISQNAAQVQKWTDQAQSA